MRDCSVWIWWVFWRCISVPMMKACYLDRPYFEALAMEFELKVWIAQLNSLDCVYLKMQKRENLRGCREFVRPKRNWCCCEMFRNEKTKREEILEKDSGWRTVVSRRWESGSPSEDLHGRFNAWHINLPLNVNCVFFYF